MALAAALAAAAAASADPIAAKQAQARQVLAQLQSLDASAQRANNAYQSATLGLQQIEHGLRVNKQALGVARSNLQQAQVTLEQRLVAIYVTRDDQNTLAVFLGAHSLTDLVNRIETIKSVSSQDNAVIEQVLTFQRQIVRHRAYLRRAHRLQAHLVAVRAAAKRRIDYQVAREQHLYNSMKAEIDHLLAQQRSRELAAARLAALRAAAQQQSADAFGVSASFDGQQVVGSSPYGGSVVSIAMRYLGVPYVWGGASPGGFDCSGLVMYVYAQVGVSLPHYTGAQWGMGVPVSRDQLQPGDLVFFDGIGHVGIYIGGGQFIHAPQTGDVVKVSSLDDPWYAANYDGARRITG